MTTDLFARWNLTPVINASGTMTGIGASRVPAEIRAVVDEVLGQFVGMDELQSLASDVIAGATGAEAGCVTGCAAAAITQTVAACLTGVDLAKIEALPRVWTERRVLLPMGHMINYGAPVDQAIRLAGADVVPVGTAAACEQWHLRASLQQGAVAAVYVVSHHTVRDNELPIDVFIEICRKHGVAVIVDMASEYDLRGPIELGASAAIYSGHKFLSGVTSGIVAGKADLVQATYLQHMGIGRTMKAGKESVAGAIAALKSWGARNHSGERAAADARVDLWMDELSGIPGLMLSKHEDWTGNPITRVKIIVEPHLAGLHAWELAGRLAMRNPRIIVRDDLIARQEIYLDPCNLTDDEARFVAVALNEEAVSLRDGDDGRKLSWSDVKRAREASTLAWNVHAS